MLQGASQARRRRLPGWLNIHVRCNVRIHVSYHRLGIGVGSCHFFCCAPPGRLICSPGCEVEPRSREQGQAGHSLRKDKRTFFNWEDGWEGCYRFDSLFFFFVVVDGEAETVIIIEAGSEPVLYIKRYYQLVRNLPTRSP